MREILFRGKKNNSGEWVYGNLFNPDKADTPTQICMGTHIVRICYEIDPETVCQFTGLYDKNGRKIFEGDIVKYGDTIHRVVFEQRNGTAYFGIVISDIETWLFGYECPANLVDVVGNIYDNPELLEEGEAE